MSVNGLNNITDRILADARAEAEKISEQAKADCEKIAADYAARADAIRDGLSGQAEKKAADMVSRAKSSAAMQKRNILMQQQSDLIDSVFSGAREWVLALSGDKYSELLAGLLAAALFESVDTEAKNRAIYGDEDCDDETDYEILLNKKDRAAYGKDILEAVRKKLSGKVPAEILNALTLSDQILNISGGAVLRRGEVECNCSFEMLFSQLRRELEADVSRALFEARGQIV